MCLLLVPFRNPTDGEGECYKGACDTRVGYRGVLHGCATGVYYRGCYCTDQVIVPMLHQMRNRMWSD